MTRRLPKLTSLSFSSKRLEQSRKKKKKVPRRLGRSPIHRSWGLASRLEHRRIKGKQKRK